MVEPPAASEPATTPEPPVGDAPSAGSTPSATGAPAGRPRLPPWASQPASGDSFEVPPVDESEHEHLRSLRTAAMLTALVGAAHAVLFLISFWLLSTVPAAGASTADIVAFYESPARRRVVVVGLYLMPFAGIAFIWFVVAMRMWVQGAARRVSVLMSNVQFVAGILYVAMLFASAAAGSVLAFSVEFADGPVDDIVAHQFPVFGSALMLVFALRMAAMFVLAMSTIGRTSGVLPTWFAWSGYVVGVFLLLTASLQPWFALVFPAWSIGLSIILVGRARRIDPALMLAQRKAARVLVVRDGPS